VALQLWQKSRPLPFELINGTLQELEENKVMSVKVSECGCVCITAASCQQNPFFMHTQQQR